MSTAEQYVGIREWGGVSARKEPELPKRRQIKKFDEQYRKKYEQGLKQDKAVLNFSKRCLSLDEKQVLTLGLNYAVMPKTIPNKTIIASTGAIARRMDSQTAEKLRSLVSTALQKATLRKFNLPRHLQEVVRALRRDESIVIVPVDKGNSTVVMDRSEYYENLEVILSDNTDRKLKKDPTAKI